MKSLMSHLTEKQREWAMVLLVFGLLLAIFHGIYGRFFPTAQGSMGHDMGLAFASCWMDLSGLPRTGWWEVPWFTPPSAAASPTSLTPSLATIPCCSG
jgi:hypothetical protein